MTGGWTPGQGGAGDEVKLALVTKRDWFASALGGILESESFVVHRVEGTGELAGALRGEGGAAGVILDADLEGDETADAVRTLRSGRLRPDVPLIVYTSGHSSDDLYAELLAAGAWQVIEGPVRSARFLALLHRFLEIARASGRETEESDPEQRRALTVDGLLERLPVLEALAQREAASVAIMAVGPTLSGDRRAADDQHSRVAEACLEDTRGSDLCGWLDAGGELAVVAYSTSREGARVLAERLAKRVAEGLEMDDPRKALSAGIVELGPEDFPRIRASDRGDGQVELLGRARRALQEARREGGGVRFAP